MGEAIASTDTPQENTGGGILQERDCSPGKDAAACQPEAYEIGLHPGIKQADVQLDESGAVTEDQLVGLPRVLPAERSALQPHFSTGQ